MMLRSIRYAYHANCNREYRKYTAYPPVKAFVLYSLLYIIQLTLGMWSLRAGVSVIKAGMQFL